MRSPDEETHANFLFDVILLTRFYLHIHGRGRFGMSIAGNSTGILNERMITAWAEPLFQCFRRSHSARHPRRRILATDIHRLRPSAWALRFAGKVPLERRSRLAAPRPSRLPRLLFCESHSFRCLP